MTRAKDAVARAEKPMVDVYTQSIIAITVKEMFTAGPPGAVAERLALLDARGFDMGGWGQVPIRRMLELMVARIDRARSAARRGRGKKKGRK